MSWRTKYTVWLAATQGHGRTRAKCSAENKFLDVYLLGLVNCEKITKALFFDHGKLDFVILSIACSQSRSWHGKNRTEEERTRQTFCDKRGNNFVSNSFPPNFHFSLNIYFVKDQKRLMVVWVKITTKLESDSPVTFVTYKLLPSVLLRKPALLAQGNLGAFLGLSTYENRITLH